jgi:SAM-dependent methyltransferase
MYGNPNADNADAPAVYAQHYLSVGVSALRCIDKALNYARKDKAVQSILDFPCGYGRVLRFLRVAFPDAEIVACEIDRVALGFCGRTFAVGTIVSDEDFHKLSFPRKFDLIWCGSLITHIDEKRTSELLRLFCEYLAPEGLCMFTTHGQTSMEWILKGIHTFGLSPGAQSKLLVGFDGEGYGYADYESLRGYGISVVSHKRMTELATSVGQWRETVFLERGWDNHQDVYGFAKVE